MCADPAHHAAALGPTTAAPPAGAPAGGGRAPGVPAAPPGLPARAGILLIRLYQLTLSPFIGRSCRYLPTCSAYGVEAIGRFGLWAGGWMTLARLLRCHPWGASGYDPVPATAEGRWWRPWRHGHWTGRHIDPSTRLDG